MIKKNILSIYYPHISMYTSHSRSIIPASSCVYLTWYFVPPLSSLPYIYTLVVLTPKSVHYPHITIYAQLTWHIIYPLFPLLYIYIFGVQTSKAIYYPPLLYIHTWRDIFSIHYPHILIYTFPVHTPKSTHHPHIFIYTHALDLILYLPIIYTHTHIWVMPSWTKNNFKPANLISLPHHL